MTLLGDSVGDKNWRFLDKKSTVLECGLPLSPPTPQDPNKTTCESRFTPTVLDTGTWTWSHALATVAYWPWKLWPCAASLDCLVCASSSVTGLSSAASKLSAIGTFRQRTRMLGNDVRSWPLRDVPSPAACTSCLPRPVIGQRASWHTCTDPSRARNPRRCGSPSVDFLGYLLLAPPPTTKHRSAGQAGPISTETWQDLDVQQPQQEFRTPEAGEQDGSERVSQRSRPQYGPDAAVLCVLWASYKDQYDV